MIIEQIRKKKRRVMYAVDGLLTYEDGVLLSDIEEILSKAVCEMEKAFSEQIESVPENSDITEYNLMFIERITVTTILRDKFGELFSSNHFKQKEV